MKKALKIILIILLVFILAIAVLYFIGSTSDDDAASNTSDDSTAYDTDEVMNESDEALAKRLSSQAADHLWNVNSITGHLVMNFDAEMDIDSMIGDEYSEEQKEALKTLFADPSMTMSFDADYEMIRDAGIVHLQGTRSSSALGQTANTSVDTYTVQEASDATVYQCEDGKWTQTTIVGESSSDIPDIFQKLSTGELELSGIKETENGDYLVTAMLSGNYLRDLMVATGAASVSSKNSNWEAAFAEVGFTFDKKTEQLKEYVIDCSHLYDTVFANSISQSAYNSVTVNSFTVTMGFNDFDSLSGIDIPKEAMEASSGDILDIFGNNIISDIEEGPDTDTEDAAETTPEPSKDEAEPVHFSDLTSEQQQIVSEIVKIVSDNIVSRKMVIQMLSNEEEYGGKYKEEDVEMAMRCAETEHSDKIDWNEEALESAYAYKNAGLSGNDLLNKLTSDEVGFTQEEAANAMNTVEQN